MYEDHHEGECRCFKCTMGALVLQRFKEGMELTAVFAGQIEGSPFIRADGKDLDVRELLKVTMVFYSYCRTLGDISNFIRNAVGGDLDAVDGQTIPPELALYLARGAEAHARAAIPVLAMAGIKITEQEPSVH